MFNKRTNWGWISGSGGKEGLEPELSVWPREKKYWKKSRRTEGKGQTESNPLMEDTSCEKTKSQSKLPPAHTREGEEKGGECVIGSTGKTRATNEEQEGKRNNLIPA